MKSWMCRVCQCGDSMAEFEDSVVCVCACVSVGTRWLSLRTALCVCCVCVCQCGDPMAEFEDSVVSDIAIFVLKRDVKLQLTN